MATVPTPEDNARKLLKIFVEDFNLRAGQRLKGLSLQSNSQKRGVAYSELDPAFQYAIRVGWIEDGSNGWFILTTSGFNAA